MDNLEDYIRKHREELDNYSPAPGIWKRIRRGLASGRKPLSGWLTAAAMIAVILGTAAVMLRHGTGLLYREKMGSGSVMMAKSSPQLREAEIYYNNLANSLYKEVSPLFTGMPEIENELYSDISRIDSLCTEIRKDLKDNVSNQDVIEALIRNYRIKIRLLEDMLEVLKEEDANSEKSNSHEL